MIEYKEPKAVAVGEISASAMPAATDETEATLRHTAQGEIRAGWRVKAMLKEGG
jgi:hypothetical protein